MPASALLVGAEVRERSRTKTYIVTLAEVNAGKTIIPGNAKYFGKITKIVMKSVGVWAAGTSVDIRTQDSTPVSVAVLPQASLTDGAILDETAIEAAAGGSFNPTQQTDQGFDIKTVGSDFTGGTRLELTITDELTDGPGVNI